MRPPEPGFFEAIPVSDKVNKVANTGPDLQERVEIGPATKAPEERKPGKPGSSRYSSDPDQCPLERSRPAFQAALAAVFAGFFFGAQISAATIAAGPMAR